MAYVRLDKIGANAHIESVVATQDIVNGQFLKLGSLQPDGEARNATPSGENNGKLVFHVSVPLTYEERTNALDFVLKAGKVGRSYVLVDGDIVSVSQDLFPVDAQKDDLVVPADNGLGFKVDAEAEGFHGEIIEFDYDANAGKLAVIRLYK